MHNDITRCLNWKLLGGSHDFPGPDGGTCINEAALVAAGFPYKSVGCSDDLPECFSRPLASFALMLNDMLPDEERQKLLPYVTRLPGSADVESVEDDRTRLIFMRLVKEILAPTMSRESQRIVAAARSPFDLLALTGSPRSMERFIGRAVLAHPHHACIDGISFSVMSAALAAADTRHIRLAVLHNILAEAFAIGKQADPIDAGLVVERAEAFKAEAAARKLERA